MEAGIKRLSGRRLEYFGIFLGNLPEVRFYASTVAMGKILMMLPSALRANADKYTPKSAPYVAH